MGIKPDSWIIRMAKEEGMLEPFAEEQVKKGVSFGVGSYGYDMRVSDEFRVFKKDATGIMDPKDKNHDHFEDYKGLTCIIPPHSFVLGKSVEYFRIPRNVITVCFGKSTYARAGVFVNVTPFEPEWEGYVTMQIANLSPLPAKIYAGEGIAQVLFFESEEDCAVSYKDKNGKYQAQKVITHAKI